MNARIYCCLLLLAGCAQTPPVLPGIDVVARDGFAALDGARIGLITNHTGRARDGRSTVRLLHEASNVELVRIFSPEHGFAGTLDIETIADGTESATGIPIVSLYGAQRRPTAEHLGGLDTLVFDIQDIGTRFYTYISTMANAMAAAAAHDIRFVVLDRPNPINGIDVAGPVLDDGRQSFVGVHTLPVRHGMTTGELALLLNAELELDLDLDVVQAEGWRRADYFDATGLAWIDPSPNMRSLPAALLYPGIGLLETTNVSVGRGTATPFEWIGAPWLDGESLAAALAALRIPGVRFSAVEFTPASSTFAGLRCEGVQMHIVDRDALEPVTLGLEIARLLRRDYPDDWQTDRYLRLLGNQATLDALLAGEDAGAIRAAYADGLEKFRKRRAAWLLYD